MSDRFYRLVSALRGALLATLLLCIVRHTGYPWMPDSAVCITPLPEWPALLLCAVYGAASGLAATFVTPVLACLACAVPFAASCGLFPQVPSCLLYANLFKIAPDRVALVSALMAAFLGTVDAGLRGLVRHPSTAGRGAMAGFGAGVALALGFAMLVVDAAPSHLVQLGEGVWELGAARAARSLLVTFGSAGLCLGALSACALAGLRQTRLSAGRDWFALLPLWIGAAAIAAWCVWRDGWPETLLRNAGLLLTFSSCSLAVAACVGCAGVLVFIGLWRWTSRGMRDAVEGGNGSRSAVGPLDAVVALGLASCIVLAVLLPSRALYSRPSGDFPVAGVTQVYERVTRFEGCTLWTACAECSGVGQVVWDADSGPRTCKRVAGSPRFVPSTRGRFWDVARERWVEVAPESTCWDIVIDQANARCAVLTHGALANALEVSSIDTVMGDSWAMNGGYGATLLSDRVGVVDLDSLCAWVSYLPRAYLPRNGRDIAISSDGRIVAVSDDGGVRLYSLPAPSPDGPHVDATFIGRLVTFADGEWVMFTPECGYHCSPDGEKHVQVDPSR